MPHTAVIFFFTPIVCFLSSNWNVRSRHWHRFKATRFPCRHHALWIGQWKVVVPPLFPYQSVISLSPSHWSVQATCHCQQWIQYCFPSPYLWNRVYPGVLFHIVFQLSCHFFKMYVITAKMVAINRAALLCQSVCLPACLSASFYICDIWLSNYLYLIFLHAGPWMPGDEIFTAVIH